MGDFVAYISFKSGYEGIVDFRDLPLEGAFRKIKSDADYFKTLFVKEGYLTWENDLMIDSDFIFENCRAHFAKNLVHHLYNKLIYNHYRKFDPIRVLGALDQEELVAVGDNSNLVLLNHVRSSIEYHVQWDRGKFGEWNTFEKIEVWTNPAWPLPNIDGISLIRWVFFEYLLPQCDALVITDNSWIRISFEAWERGLKTYFITASDDLVEVRSTQDIDSHRTNKFIMVNDQT
jgi:hypothetical protein